MMNDTGTKPQILRPNLDNILDELKAIDQWVLWRLVLIKGKWDKIPYMPNRKAASVTDSTTWSPFAGVVAAYQRGGFDGIGFVLTRSAGIVGIDIDKLQTHKHQPEVRKILAAVHKSGAYVERSPSGTGFRAFIRGQLPFAGTNKQKLGVELYAEGRYLTVTGHQSPGSGAVIVSSQEAIDEIVGIACPAVPPAPASQPAVGPVATTSTGLSDAEVLQRARTAKNGPKFTRLWDGQWQGDYGSQSEADLALCGQLAFWTGKNAAQMDRLFRSSGLMRDKWDETHGAKTYGEMTVTKAIDSTTEVYTPPTILPAGSKSAALAGGTTATTVATPRFKLKTIDKVLQQPPPRWLVHGIIQEGKLVVVYGGANTGKSFLVLSLVLAVVRGVDWFGHRTMQGAVVYLAIEGTQRNRLAAYVWHHRLLQPLSNFRLVDVSLNLRDRPPKTTDAQELVDAIRVQLGDTPISAVVVDTLNQALQGGDENTSEDMGAFIANANEIRVALGCAVVVIHHAGKDQQKGARGHSSLKCAIDTEIEVTYDKDSPVRTASITKQRDGRDDEVVHFTLTLVDLGPDPDDPNARVTSCVVVPPSLTMPLPVRGKSAPKGKNQKIAWQKFRGMMKVSSWPIASGEWAVVESDLLDAVAKSLPPPAKGPDRRRQQAHETIDGMCKAGWFDGITEDVGRFLAPGILGAGHTPPPTSIPEMQEMPDFA